MNDSLLSKMFSFRLASLGGILIALYVFSLRTDDRPLSFFLYNPTLYIAATSIALVIRVLLWILVDRGTFYEFSRNVMRTIGDCILINIVLLSTLSFLFLMTTFFKS